MFTVKRVKLASFAVLVFGTVPPAQSLAFRCQSDSFALAKASALGAPGRFLMCNLGLAK